MGAVAEDSFMSSLIGTGNSLFNLELLSSSPFPLTKSNSRDRWLERWSPHASSSSTEGWPSKSYASLPLVFAGLLGFEALSALIAINWGRSHLPLIVEKHWAVCILLEDCLRRWWRAAAHTTSATTVWLCHDTI